MRGGYGTTRHGNLADRRASSTGVAAGHEPEPEPLLPASPARHCLVEGQPALLVEWRRGSAGWEGRVITVRWLEPGGWSTVEHWLPAAAIDRAPERH